MYLVLEQVKPIKETCLSPVTNIIGKRYFLIRCNIKSNTDDRKHIRTTFWCGCN